MGSGSSKQEKGKETSRDAKTGKPAVANVNSRSTPAKNSVSQPKQPVQNTFITQPDDTLEDSRNTANQTRSQDLGDNITSYDRPARKQTTQVDSVWRADQESQDDLNEVLQMPTDNRHSSRPVHAVNPVRQEDLPETYAQRKQREQYRLNQQLLLRQKTIYRNPDDWREEEDVNAVNTGTSGFDPSRFRSVNQGKPPKSNIFTTTTNQDESVQYMHDQENMDEFDVTPRQKNTSKELPTYNASEQDLMASLERELM